MTLERAIEVLNEKKYKFCSTWHNNHDEGGRIISPDNIRNVGKLEAISIAEKLVEVVTIEEAIEVLNENDHRGSKWRVEDSTKICSIHNGLCILHRFTHAEAIAIANYYRKL